MPPVYRWLNERTGVEEKYVFFIYNEYIYVLGHMINSVHHHSTRNGGSRVHNSTNASVRSQLVATTMKNVSVIRSISCIIIVLLQACRHVMRARENYKRGSNSLIVQVSPGRPSRKSNNHRQLVDYIEYPTNTPQKIQHS